MTHPIANIDACLARADEAAALAATTKLPNVRARQLSSEQAWREMAARLIGVKETAAETIAAKAALCN